MTLNQNERETIRSYLLGKLDQIQLTQVEQRLLTVHSFYDELLMAEDELTDQYLANALTNEERIEFETHFLSTPERRQKLRFARSLKRFVSQSTATREQEDNERSFAPSTDTELRSKKRPFLSSLFVQRPVIAYSLAAAILLVVLGISWSMFNIGKPNPGGQEKVLVAMLTPGLTREAGETKSIKIPRGTGSVHLELGHISEEYQSYRAELITSERASVLVKENLKPESSTGNKTIIFPVPAAFLKRDDYRVKLSGRRPDGGYEDMAGYVFRVVE